MTVLLELADVHVRRGRAGVLHGVSLSVDAGEVVALIGSNGVGKSTTLRTISGLHRPHAGAITFDGERVDRWAPQRIVQRGISHVPEGRLVFPALTVTENLEMGAFTVGGLDHAALDHVFERFPDLRRFQSAPAGSLSGGQQQMLAIARGIVAKPKILLLDEPSLGLSPVMVRSITATLADLSAEGMTILLVEQNAGLALSVASRGYVMVDGRVALDGSTADLQTDERVRRAYLGI